MHNVRGACLINRNNSTVGLGIDAWCMVDAGGGSRIPAPFTVHALK